MDIIHKKAVSKEMQEILGQLYAKMKVLKKIENTYTTDS